MLERFKKYIQRNQLIKNGETVLLGISGGVDSIVMGHLFFQAGIKTEWAHCNFHLRGSEADGDEAFVRSFASKLEVPLHVQQFDTKGYAQKKGISIQMAARDLRFGWFDDLLVQLGCNSVATAHHSGDSIETFFVNLLRGTGLKGLKGIAPKNGHLIHPLLFCSREDILNYAHQHELAFREDSSNASVKYLRNKIRHQLLPLLTEMNPAFEENMLANLQHLQQSWEIQEQQNIQAKTACFSHQKALMRIDLQELKKWQPENAFLFSMLEPYGFNGSDVKSILSAVSFGSGKIFHSSTHRLLIDRNCLLIKKRGSTKESTNYIIHLNENNRINFPLNLTWECFDRQSDFKPHADHSVAFFDMDTLKQELHLRKWQYGDSFIPFGMQGRKKISDFLIDEKVNVFDKEDVYVLLSGLEIIWVIGYRSAQPFRITPKTNKILKIKLF